MKTVLGIGLAATAAWFCMTVPSGAALLTAGSSPPYGGYVCADVASGIGPAVQVYDCAGWENQQWDFQASSLRNQLIARSDPGECLDLVGGTGPGTVLAACVQNSPSQDWAFDNGSLINQGNGQCLDAGSMQNGTKLQTNSCQAITSQNWQIK